MCVRLVGYSERGMVNALCYDLVSRQDLKQIETFLSWFDYSHLDNQERPCFSDIKSAQLIVEQSFSDFGDLDLLVLLEHTPPSSGGAPRKQAMLIEAKVSTDTNSWQTLGDRFGEFLRMVDGGEGSTSNLFVQLHRKVRLVEFLTNENISFSPDLFTPRGSLGTNQVVEGAKQALEGFIKAGGRAWYGAIVPDDPVAMATFARDILRMEDIRDRLPRWDARHWGFLSWHTVKARVEPQESPWPFTRATFEWNEGQIFRDNPPVVPDIQPGGIYLHGERHVFVVPAKMGQNCRVALLEEGAPAFFWTTKTVPLAEIQAVEGPVPLYLVPVLPKTGLSYAWVDRGHDLPPTDEPHPPGMADETPLVVIGRNWRTSRVRIAGALPEEPSFLVRTHYLRRNPVGQ